MKGKIKTALLGCCIVTLTLQSGLVLASSGDEGKIEKLEGQMQTLLLELQDKQSSIDTLNSQVVSLESKMDKVGSSRPTVSINLQDKTELKEMVAQVIKEREEESPHSRFSFGGYGEIHANITEGNDSSGNSNDLLDIHRLVAYVGYDFSDWIKFRSEVELEHAFVADGSGGEVEIEQAYIDFLLNDKVNIRVGRTLVPLGIVNQHHEPTTFNGVERPSFAKYIIPATWWSDGIGIFGNLTTALSYEASVIAGLDGSKFSATKGIRSSRLKERPSLNEMALALRFDYYPLLNSASAWGQNLRLGTSFYHGGINNGNKGKDPGINGDLTIYSVDFQAKMNGFDFKGVVALEEIKGAENLSGVAEEIFGYYLETGYHFMPDSWKQGKLKNSDAVAFVRYDKYDTQYKMVAGVVGDPAGDRHEWTMGLSFYPVPNLVIKADYQIKKSAAADPANTINFGIGWQF